MRIMVSQYQSSVMGFYNRVAKCQAKSQTSVTVRNCCFPGIKHLENMRLHFVWDSGAIVFYADLRFSILRS